ncbi:hypothetical protein LCGC14_1218630 [marine sediment metagenome]|uniref:Uncharacterized protein n=1 Tax=marine sediment metagenome TaxID=412755 RepID=A0A0F9NU68_9ZZZZ
MFAVDCEFGKTIVATCTCECGALLTLPWGGAYGLDSFVIKCAADPSHDKVVPVKSFYQMWKDGEELPSFIKDNIERKLRRKIMEQNNVKALVVKQDADKLSTYLQVRFPQDLARREAALDFAKWCIAHQLEPIRDCVPYHGNPYITIEWVDRQASQDKGFKGYSYKVFSQQDKEALDFDSKDLVVECQANWDGLEQPLVGLGVVTKLEKESVTGGPIDEATGKGYRSPVIHLKPQQMVFKRARAATFKQHYHIPAPILEELPYTTVVEAEYRIIPEPEGAEETGKAAGEKVAAAPKAKAQATNPVSAPAAEERSPDEAIEGEGFSIDPTWLSESQKTLKWTGDTCKTFLVSKYKVSPQGTLEDVIKRLTREQAEDFVDDVNSRLEKQPGLFE